MVIADGRAGNGEGGQRPGVGPPRGFPPYLFLDLRLGDQHACGLMLDGLLACWGRDREGQLNWPLPNDL